MDEKSENVTMKGSALTLVGKFARSGQAPDVELMNQELKAVKLSSLKGKPLLLLSVPSLDTSVCSLETARFNQEITAFGKNLSTVVVSMDLPFAQKRWCGQEKAIHLMTLSDYKNHEFGKKYGVYIQELGLLARAVFVIDRDFTIRFAHLVKEVTHEPNYEEVLSEVKKVLSGNV